MMTDGPAAARKEISTVRSGMLSHINVAPRYSVDGVGNAGWFGGSAAFPKTPLCNPEPAELKARVAIGNGE
jgi:hypothetical protein